MNKKWPAFLWLVVISVVSGFPGDKVPKIPVWQFDKLVHSVIYFVLVVLLLAAFQKQYEQPNKRFKAIVLVLLFSVFYGGIMEILQHYIFINRSGNWYDFVANSFGAVLAVFCYPFVIKLLPKIS